MRHRTVAVTGVAGFIGSNLADRLLAEGHSVVGIDNLAYGVREQVPEGVTFHRIDVRDRAIGDVLRGCDALFHLAAKNCIADCQADPVETADVNVTGTVNVLAAAGACGIGKVVYAESSALYEGAVALPTAEDQVSPRSFYAASKMAGALFAEAFARYRNMLPTALRYFCVYGPRQDYRRSVPPVASAFIIKLLAGERPTIYGDGRKRRDFIYVDDVNDFHLRCLDDARTDGRTFNLGSGTNVGVREIFDEIRDLLGSDLEPLYAPDLEGEALETLADIGAARSIGWTPRTSLREGLRRSIAYIRDAVPAPSASGTGRDARADR